MILEPFIALTDKRWFDFLQSIGTGGVVDEVNFWSPRATQPMKRMGEGEPVFFKLKNPLHCIAGYGYFAHFARLDREVAWETFGDRNGFSNRIDFFDALGGYRRSDTEGLHSASEKLACTILRDAVFWPKDRWIPWGIEQGWPMQVTRGATERDPVRVQRLLSEMQYDQHVPPEEFADSFELVDADDREIVTAQTRLRVGQGAFRTRLLTAYGSRCAISGERTEPVLDAAHVQPYLGPRSNHIQNGLLLAKELHVLFDRGLMTVTPDLRVRVSPRISKRWSNGRRFYDFNDRPLVVVPEDVGEQPSKEALRWHNERMFVA